MIWLLVPLVTATMLILGARSDDAATGLLAIGIVVEGIWAPGLWLLAAAGVGSGLACLLERRHETGSRPAGVLQTWALGVAGMLAIDLLLGLTGSLTETGAIRVLTGLLAVAGLWSLRRIRPKTVGIGLAAAIPIGTLLLAAASTPGWLWGTEFGGYDALSYHLQLPREWWLAGAIIETPHNAYGYLPNGVEAAFLHVMTMIGDPDAAAVPCQLLVACVTMLAAAATGELAVAMLGRHGASEDRSLVRQLGFVALLATPWVIVVGSLAYDEAIVLLLATTAFTVILEEGRGGAGSSISASPTSNLRIGAWLGILLGGAVLAKASSGPLVVIPAFIAAALLIPRRAWFPIVLTTTMAGVVICGPWLIRNLAWTGNPMFPFGSSIFGSGDWTAEQIGRFAAGHHGDGMIAGLRAIGSEFLFEDWNSPSGVDPQRLQWAWLPLAGLVALSALSVRRKGRGIALAILCSVVAMILIWAFYSHAKARFLLPAAPLLAAAVAIIATRMRSDAHVIIRGLTVMLVWLAAGSPAIVYAFERDGLPAVGVDQAAFFDGSLEATAYEQAGVAGRVELLGNASPAFILNHRLPETARILLLGRSDPFHFDFTGEPEGLPRISYQTVWTRGPFEEAIAAGDAKASTDAQVAAAIDRLRSAGFTHLFIQLSMLDRWMQAGWLATELQPRFIEALLRQQSITRRFGNQALLIEL
ncbi:MAG: hypothetical protein O3A19_01715 [Planctomycetota bacterium]|nr:hypothetical protein [Planctomycetota bacterium]MDA1025124.1 hypothetical protein [Planctomycetota bacterium]